MVADTSTRINLFVVGLSRQSSKEGKLPILIRDMDIARLMIHTQQVEEDKQKDREGFKNKRAKTLDNEFWHQKSRMNQSSFQHKHKRPAPPSSSTPAPINKVRQIGHFLRKCPENRNGSGNQGNRAQSSSVAPPDGLHQEELRLILAEEQTTSMR
ncbi:uncharacterized protein LOC107019748 [Solanum pennellii]|uniref:Uncharacterized protein LOC107019748 n=1 Tax=Solanum pennellii TaxID=28526 RepID=A0ABM1GT41_SOLPN|nr:uncharacterized protein LOC107019748 [Solanum pennellii]